MSGKFRLTPSKQSYDLQSSNTTQHKKIMQDIPGLDDDIPDANYTQNFTYKASVRQKNGQTVKSVPKTDV